MKALQVVFTAAISPFLSDIPVVLIAIVRFSQVAFDQTWIVKAENDADESTFLSASVKAEDMLEFCDASSVIDSLRNCVMFWWTERFILVCNCCLSKVKVTSEAETGAA